MNRNLFISILLGLFFFILGVSTLTQYGINWDTINHLPRGQAYLHYFLTGRKDYKDLPPYVQYYQKPESLGIDTDISPKKVPHRSIYQMDATTFNWFMENDGGHPPISDILSSMFNYVLFQKLRLINDIDSYRVYGIFLSSCLIGLIFWWTNKVYGKFAGLIAVISLTSYPLFWSESHFNTEKDIPEAVFLSFFIFCFWKSFINFNIRWLFTAGIFLGLALGTKFNAVFAPLIIILWIGYLVVGDKWRRNLKEIFVNNKKFAIFCLFIPVIVFAIFLVSWPYLWADPIYRIKEVIGFYKGIGLTTTFNDHYLFFGGFNSYPLQAIFYTTPIPVLFLFILGILYIVKNINKKEHKALLALFLIWFIVSVGRVTWPGMSIYGGLRQIMEYIPVMAIISGLGGGLLHQFFLKRLKLPLLVVTAFVLLFFVPHLVKMVQIHPNQNVYFNEFMGGLSVAQKKEFLFWGNSFGAAYRQGIVWLNSNVPIGGKVVMARELMPNIPIIWIRPDINFHNSQRSGYLQMGEYAIGLTYQGTRDYSYYDGFLENFVQPVYQVKVDGVGILKIWENSNSKLGFDPKETSISEVQMQKYENGLRFDLGREYNLSRLEISYSEMNCQPLKSGVVRISTDNDKWQTLVGVLPKYWRIGVLGQQPKNGNFIEPFYGQQARYIDLVLSPISTCLKQILKYKIFIYKIIN